MLLINNISDLDLKENEYCYLVGDQYYRNANFDITVPRIMSKVTKGKESFNRNIFVNDSACKPSVSSSLMMQNYITVPRSGQCSLRRVARESDLMVPNGTGVNCTVTNGSYKEMKLIDYK